MMVGAVGRNFERVPPREHFSQIWFNLVQQFQREDLNVIIFQNMPNLQNRHASAEKRFHIITRNIC